MELTGENSGSGIKKRLVVVNRLLKNAAYCELPILRCANDYAAFLMTLHVLHPAFFEQYKTYAV